MKTKTLIVAQLFISCIMAFLMTGIFTLIHTGMNYNGLLVWMDKFIVAWPIAFILSLFVSRISFYMATKLTNSPA